MKIYELEFEFFNGVYWRVVVYNITANNKFQLMKAFLETADKISINHCSNRGKTPEEKVKNLWEESKNKIEEKELPLIKDTIKDNYY